MPALAKIKMLIFANFCHTISLSHNVKSAISRLCLVQTGRLRAYFFCFFVYFFLKKNLRFQLVWIKNGGLFSKIAIFQNGRKIFLRLSKKLPFMKNNILSKNEQKFHKKKLFSRLFGWRRFYTKKFRFIAKSTIHVYL